jgi:hypothetical protein
MIFHSAEQMASILVDNLLHLKSGPDAAILELEKQEQEMILEKVNQFSSILVFFLTYSLFSVDPHQGK